MPIVGRMLDLSSSESEIQEFAKSINEGEVLILPAGTKVSAATVAAQSMKPGAFLFINSDLSEEVAIAAARRITNGAILYFRSTTPESLTRAMMKHLNPTAKVAVYDVSAEVAAACSFFAESGTATASSGSASAAAVRVGN